MRHHPGASLCRDSPAFHRPVLQFSSLELELAFRLISTKDTVTQSAFTFIIHDTPHLPWENFADNLKALSW